MTPLHYAIHSVGRAVDSFRPSSMPVLSRASYHRELITWSLLPVALGAVEGGVVGVIAKNAFAGSVPDAMLNLTVAILASAPALANILSFLWAALAHGRNKIFMTNMLQIATLLMVGLIALVPFNMVGLAMLVIGAVGARVCWSGVTILRSTIWRANYPRNTRATLAGKLATVQALVLAATSFVIGQAMEWDERAIRVVYPAAIAVGFVGVFVFRKLRMRGHRALLIAEQTGEAAVGRSFNPIGMWNILCENVPFRQYMTWMFIFGFGNLMTSAPLIIILRDHFELRQGTSMLIAATVPLLMMPLSIPFWSRLLDRMHIIQFRAIHCWAFVSSIALVLLGSVLELIALLWISAVVKGIAFGGGVLGWNLGHHDFAPADRASQYMGVHVTLTGIRGMIAPFLAVGIYELLESLHDGGGSFVFAVCLCFSLTGAMGFVFLARKMRQSDD